MSNTFTKQVSFISKTFVESTNEWVEKPITKTATFLELSRTEKKQHKLHFAIVGLFTSSLKGEGDEQKVNLDSDQIYDITVRYVKDLLMVSDSFTEVDKKEFLNDSGALWEFGYTLVSERLVPFFQILIVK